MSVAQLSRGIARLFPELARTDIDPSRFAKGVLLGIVLGAVGGAVFAVLFWPIGIVGLFAPLLVILLAKASIAVSAASNREGIDREFVFILSELQFAVIVGSGYETVIDSLASNRDLKYAAKAAQLAKRIMRMSPGIHPLDAIMSALKKLNASEKLLSLYNSILKAVEMGEDVAARINTIVNTLVSDFLDSMTRRVNNVVEAISALMASMMDFVLLMIAMSMSSGGGAPIFNLAIGLVILPAVFYFILWGLVSIPYMEMYVSPRAFIPFAAAVAAALLVSPFAGAAVSLVGYVVLRRESATWRAYLRNSMEFIIDLAQNLKSAPVLQVLNALAKSRDYGPFNVFVLRLARAAESGEDLASLVQGFRIPKLSRIVMRILFDTLRLGRISVAILDSLITFTVGLRSLTDRVGKSMMIVKIIIVLTTVMAILITYFTATLSSVITGVAGAAGATAGATTGSMFVVGKLMVINIAMASLFLSRTDFNIVNSLLYFGLFSIILGVFDMVAPSLISLMFSQPTTS